VAGTLLLGFCLSTTTTLAQAKADDEPVVQELELKSSDGFPVQVLYFPATAEDEDEQKETVPVIILHKWKGQAADYEELALYLQSLGHTVVVPDLRGHGASSVYRDPDGTREVKLNPDRFKSPEMIGMIEDVEAVKQFLIGENNKEKLNIEKLCVIGVEVGTLVALNWAVKDWNWQDTLKGKQGKDVKGLVLVSPVASMRGLDTSLALRHPLVQREPSILIIVGQKDRLTARLANRLHGQLKRFHPDPPPALVEKEKTLFLVEHDTTLQGDELLAQGDFQNKEIIAAFIKARLVDNKKLAWKKRFVFGN
jgi:pimeloyl-ACP methyl ester carboxylesterase